MALKGTNRLPSLSQEPGGCFPLEPFDILAKGFVPVRMVAEASLPRHGADLVGLRGHRHAQLELQAERGVRGWLEGEFLEQSREEEEELGAGQRLTQAGALPCGDSHPRHLQHVLAAELLLLPKKPLPSLRTVVQLCYPLPRMNFAVQIALPNNSIGFTAWAAP